MACCDVIAAATADLMAILRLAVDSRKVQLVDIALDLIQKLIAHQHIQGPVFSISHRRDAGGKDKRRATEDDEDMESNSGDSSLPQVLASMPSCTAKLPQHFPDGPKLEAQGLVMPV